MKLVTIRTDDGTVAGRIEGDAVVELDAPDVGTLLAGANWDEAVRSVGTAVRALAEVSFAPVVPRPGKIICVGLNYRTHIREMGRGQPTHPTLFAKFADALVGARDPIILPRASTQADWEAELAVIIGAHTRTATEREARGAIAGFTVMNDVSIRDWQHRTSQWLAGKTFDSTSPLGPALVTPDEVDWAADLRVMCSVDGSVMQDARTSDLLFDPVDLVRYVSEITTLWPGDVIATGTPGGVGVGREPPIFLRSGQELRTEIEGLGHLLNVCRDGGP